jgi:hypothetical protein
MATTVNTGQVGILSNEAVLVVPENADRTSLILIVMGGYVAFGPDDSVTYDTGLVWKQSDGPLIDNVPATSAWWARSPLHNHGRVTFCEWVTEP